MSTITLWVVLGTCLLIAEMLTGTFFLLFLALGAFSASLLALFGLDSFPLQIFICGLVSLAGFFILKKPLQKKMLKAASVQNDLGQRVQVDHAIAAGQMGRVNYQGTTWEARNTDSHSLSKGDSALIVGTEGHILLLKKEILNT